MRARFAARVLTLGCGLSLALSAAAQESGLAPDESPTLSAEELAAIGLKQDEAGHAQLANPIELHGFADFSSRTMLMPASNAARAAYQRHSSFFIGNFNIYLSSDLTEKLRMLSEVRFLFLPNGAPQQLSASGEYTSTRVNDYAASNRPLSWGGVEIERVYLEWAAHRALTFRAGVFLTPYGIWNVDHGSPTIVTVEVPFIISAQLFPERQTGLEVYGRFSAGMHHTYGYHLTLSNGFGSVSAYRDLDRNKAVGGRVYWSYTGLGELRIGASAFYGTDTSARELASLRPDGYVDYTEKVDAQARVLALAGDVRFTLGGLLLQSEVVHQQRQIPEHNRVGALNPLVGQYLAPIDNISFGVYGLAGYRLPWFGVMPFLMVQSFRATDDTSAALRVRGVITGLNVRPLDAFAFKLEYTHSIFPDGLPVLKPGDSLRMLQAQLAWAF